MNLVIANDSDVLGGYSGVTHVASPVKGSDMKFLLFDRQEIVNKLDLETDGFDRLQLLSVLSGTGTFLLIVRLLSECSYFWYFHDF